VVSTRSFLVGLMFSFAIAGCDHLDQDAKEAHAKVFGCSPSEVHVEHRHDVDPYAILFGGRTPPPNVNNDRAALDAWKAKRQAAHAAFIATGEVFEAQGCEKKALYFCKRQKGSGGRTCESLDRPASGASDATPE
jgi:hypothetical protein